MENIDTSTIIALLISTLILSVGITTFIFNYRNRKKDETQKLLKEEELKEEKRLREEERKMFEKQLLTFEQKFLNSEKENRELLERLVKVEEQNRNDKTQAKTNNKEKAIVQHKTALDEYCYHIFEQHRYLKFAGMSAYLKREIELETIYVKLRAKREHWHGLVSMKDYRNLDKAFQIYDRQTKAASREFINVFAAEKEEAKGKNKALRMLILGQPGSGKTTLMKWIALQACKAHQAKDTTNVFAPYIPVLIFLKDFSRHPDFDFRTQNLKDIAIKLLKRGTSDTVHIHRLFEENRLLFLLDGLDEIGDELTRRHVIEWIEEQYIGKNILLISSRFSGLQPQKGLQFRRDIPVYCIQDFTLEDIIAFLRVWYENIEVAAADETKAEEAKAKSQEAAEELIKLVEDDSYKNLQQLAVNPLLLTIIVLIHRWQAVLPKERHLLYERALKTMLELWRISKGFTATFSYEVSLDKLSILADELMIANTRELKKKDIVRLLGERVEGKSTAVFLDEMIRNAGLLYESEGQYGFIHLTFQEYLTAYQYANAKAALEILQYRDKSYWNESFKLFFNMGERNAKDVFGEIGHYLAEKEYYKQMNLWDACLKDITKKELQEQCEKQFAKDILTALARAEYREENEKMLIQLMASYVLYKHANSLTNTAFHLLENAEHPFVRSVAASILNRAEKSSQRELAKILKKQLNTFAKQKSNKENDVNFVYQHNNSTLILLAATKNILDFCFVLKKLAAGQNDILSFWILRYLRDLLDLRYLLDLRDLRYLRYLRDLLDLRYLRDLRYLLDLRYLRDLLDLLQHFYKHQAVIQKYQFTIRQKTISSFEQLRAMSDEELLKYFPNTSAKDLQRFRRDDWGTF